MVLVKQKIDIFKTQANVLVNPVNTKAVSGCGLAKQFKLRYPSIQRELEQAARNKVLSLGFPYLLSSNLIEEAEDWLDYVILLPTKIAPDRKESTKYETITTALELIKNRCFDFFPQREDFKIAIPLIGCGAGKLDRKVVADLIEGVLGDEIIKQTIILCV